MRILLVASAFNSPTQPVRAELRERGARRHSPRPRPTSLRVRPAPAGAAA
ncbi:hypothetical protein [Kitasatospora aureofaciens]